MSPLGEKTEYFEYMWYGSFKLLSKFLFLPFLIVCSFVLFHILSILFSILYCSNESLIIKSPGGNMRCFQFMPALVSSSKHKQRLFSLICENNLIFFFFLLCEIYLNFHWSSHWKSWIKTMDFQPDNYTNIFLDIFPYDFSVWDIHLGNRKPRHAHKINVCACLPFTLVLPLLMMWMQNRNLEPQEFLPCCSYQNAI